METEENTPYEYIESTREAVEAWKSAPPSVMGSAMSTLLSPVTWLVGKVVPPSVIVGVLTSFDWLAKNTLTGAGSPHFNDLRECDRRADQVQNFHIGLAAAEGGAAGFFGLAALPADVAALIALSLRLIRQVGVEYGYAEDNEAEKEFCFSVMRGASANTVEEKATAQFILAELSQTIAKQTWKSMAEKAANGVIGKEAAITALRALAKQVGVNLTKRKALEAIPVLGSVVGAATSGWFLREIGIAAQMSYRQRWLDQHAHITELAE
jgi:DNA-binding transcriptional regulator YhcF (GntR family)